MTRRKPAVRALKPNHQERNHRHAAIDALLVKAILGELTTPEAALLAEHVRAEQRIGEQTRRSLRDTTRALERHREAAAETIQELEARIAELEGQQQEAAA